MARTIGAEAPEFVCVPTDVLVCLAPRKAVLCKVNFSFNNLFDNTAAREDLGFRVNIPWVEGAQRTIRWLEENGKLENSKDFPFYDRVIEEWRPAVGRLSEIS